MTQSAEPDPLKQRPITAAVLQAIWDERDHRYALQDQRSSGSAHGYRGVPRLRPTSGRGRPGDPDRARNGVQRLDGVAATGGEAMTVDSDDAMGVTIMSALITILLLAMVLVQPIVALAGLAFQAIIVTFVWSRVR
jgi:hypothetical protein